MCSTNYGMMLDFMVDNDDPLSSKLMNDSVKNKQTMFSQTDVTASMSSADIKQELMDFNNWEFKPAVASMDWKAANEWDNEAFMESILPSDIVPSSELSSTSTTSLETPTMETMPGSFPTSHEDMDDLNNLEDLIGLPFNSVFGDSSPSSSSSSASSASGSDSGLDTDSSFEHQMSPESTVSGYGSASPAAGVGISSAPVGLICPSPGDLLENASASSEVSSMSDLESMTTIGGSSPLSVIEPPPQCTPEDLLALDYDDDTALEEGITLHQPPEQEQQQYQQYQQQPQQQQYQQQQQQQLRAKQMTPQIISPQFKTIYHNNVPQHHIITTSAAVSATSGGPSPTTTKVILTSAAASSATSATSVGTSPTTTKVILTSAAASSATSSVLSSTMLNNPLKRPLTITTSSASSGLTSGNIFKTVTVPAGTISGTLNTVRTTNSGTRGNIVPAAGQTIVVTQDSAKSGTPTLLRGGTTLLKSTGTTTTSAGSSRSILYPVNMKDITMKDINQGALRTIKIINSGNSGIGGRGVRAVVSALRNPGTTTRVITSLQNGTIKSTPIQNTNLRTIITPKNLLETTSSKCVVKTLPTTTNTLLKTTSSTTPICSTSSTINATPLVSTSIITRIKEEPKCDLLELASQYQEVKLSDEEKRLLKKEAILLPSHYPLTKQEERELKRIRRKIRNKISAQDSRKRKKDYIDGLEDRVKQCTDENQQLQKRIKSLESENATLMVQMKRFQSLVTGSVGRAQSHASTALMMLVLSAALFLVPSLKSEYPSGTDTELAMSSKMPATGHSRSLLEANTGSLVSSVLEGVEEDKDIDLDVPSIEALNDHDYAPPAKRYKTMADPMYMIPPVDDLLPHLQKTDSGGGEGIPPDERTTREKAIFSVLTNILDKFNINLTDPGGQKPPKIATKPLTVNLTNTRKRFRDDVELE